MTGIKIYECTAGCGGDNPTYTLRYTANNCQRLSIRKSSGIIPFSLPIVDTTQETTGRGITEKIDLIKISGIEASLNLTFDIHVSDMWTLLDLSSNNMGKNHKIVLDDWSTDLDSVVNFIGFVGEVEINYEGGDDVLSCTLYFLEGDNLFADFINE